MNFFDVLTSRKPAKRKADQEVQDTGRPWVEKYRPKTMDDITSQEQTVNVLKKALHSDNLPHLLFYGPPGTGKTSTILALAQDLYGPTLAKTRVLELNASDERGIQIVREKVKNFSRLTVTRPEKGFPCPPFKIVILDEADSMTKDAQSALRRTMETYSKTTRFCLICNYVSRIIEPITSRCAKFRFTPLPLEGLTKCIQSVCVQEGVTLGAGTMEALIKASNGDLRKAITFVQSAFALYQDKPIPPDSIRELAGMLSKDALEKISDAWRSRDFQLIQQVAEDIINEGYSAGDVVSQIHDEVMRDDSLTCLQKAKIAQLLSRADGELVHGADDHLQVFRLLLGMSAAIAQE